MGMMSTFWEPQRTQFVFYEQTFTYPLVGHLYFTKIGVNFSWCSLVQIFVWSCYFRKKYVIFVTKNLDKTWAFQDVLAFFREAVFTKNAGFFSGETKRSPYRRLGLQNKTSYTIHKQNIILLSSFCLLSHWTTTLITKQFIFFQLLPQAQCLCNTGCSLSTLT